MTNQAKIAVFTLLFTTACLASPPQAKSKAAAPKPSATAPAQSPESIAASQLPLTPAQMPPTPAKVTMSNGMISIVATNSTMGDVLNGIHKATGATIDAPPGANSERVAVNIGPADPRDALQDLFEGSKFDYIIVGSPEDDLKLQRVILTPRGGGALASAVASNTPGSQPPRPTGYQPPADNEADNPTDEEVMGVPEPASPEQIPNQQGLGQPGLAGSQVDQNQNPGLPPDQQQQQQKTPEQLLQDLQRMQRPSRGDQQQPPPTPR